MRRCHPLPVFTVATFIAASLLVACGGGGGGTTTTVPGPSSSGVTEEIREVPLAGQLVSDCLETGQAILEGFVPEDVPVPDLAALPTLAEVLAGDPSAIPVIGGFIPDAVNPEDLLPITAEEVLAMLNDALPDDLPVIGALPVSCSEVPVPAGELPDPSDVVGLIPVFDEIGDPIGFLLATVDNLTNGDLPDVTELDLPVGLPVEIGEVASTLLGLIPIPLPL